MSIAAPLTWEQQKVLNLTKRIVEEHQLTCLMITTICSHWIWVTVSLMMDSGNIVLDIHRRGEKDLTVEGLPDKFKTGAGKMLDNDRILFSNKRINNEEQVPIMCKVENE